MKFQKGHIISKEIRQEISDSLKGKKKAPRSEEHKRKLSLALKGKTSWLKGKHIQSNTGKTHFKKGQIPWNKGKRYSNPKLKGRHHTKEEIEKQKESWMRTFLSNPETREKMITSHKGKSAWWNKGLIRSEETRRKIGLAGKGRIPWMAGKHHTSKTLKKLSESLKGREVWNKGKKGLQVSWNKGTKGLQISGMKGKKHSEESRKKISEALKGLLTGEKHPQWRGGISFEPYSRDWTKALKKFIRERDNHTCQICFKKGNHVHHIDYNKKNCNPENLITLCVNCHMKTNVKREKWIEFFKNKIN